jgi:hypothetical protein
MTDEEILQKVIIKAEKNGYKGHMQYLPMFLKRDPSKKKKLSKKDFMKFMSRIWFIHKNDIIYSHEFAKAFFGEKKHMECCGSLGNNLKEYQYYLMWLVKIPHPIIELEKFL